MIDFYPVHDLKVFAYEFFSGWNERREELASSNDPKAILGHIFPLKRVPDHIARVPKEKSIAACSLGHKAAETFWGCRVDDPEIYERGDEFVITIRAKS